MWKRLVVLAVLVPAGMFGANVTFTLDPVGGPISGTAGSTVGWGFTFANSDSDYALVTGAAYLGSPDIGAFVDFISGYQFVFAGPGTASVTQTFDPVNHTGVGSFAIDGAASVAAFTSGVINITYDVYSVSPNDNSFDPGADLVSSGSTVSPAARVDVAAADTVVVPEPGLGVVAGLILAALVKRHRAHYLVPDAATTAVA